ncbi:MULTISPECIES: hypothetical protein [unclassified Streptomyces]|uniref:hypothetical protein n=1 Tax=unclassified Streptomyces TaxID=2593676 RepID=UPI000DBA3290|nr:MULTISPECIES: hypothetical protein [unclassified Streptomyces]MYT75207.1 hypothetical protein [Streptomyces sp. SID8367]RAJ77163.1 hypothetical protein K377_05921 [Streptomyces sp. PsTaAH-137]
MSDPQQRLQRALDALDEAFVPARDFVLDGCLYCYGEADVAALAGPPEAVPDDLVTTPLSEVPSHWDKPEEMLRRMVPRIARLLVRGETYLDEGLIGTRFVQADWTGWPPAETAALRELWSAWWAATLDRYPAPMPAHDVLNIVTVVTGALSPWLDVWEHARTPSADRHLEELVDLWCFEDQLSELKLGFYDEYDATPELLPWVLGHGRTRIGPSFVAQLDELEQYSSYLNPPG